MNMQGFGGGLLKSNAFGVVDKKSDKDILSELVSALEERNLINRLVFKGGWVLSNFYGSNRNTMDVDAFFKEYSDDCWREILTCLEDYCAEKGYTIKKVRQPIKGTMSAGIEFVHNGRTYGIDISIDDFQEGTREVYMNGSNLEIYTVERVISDKLSVLFSKKRFRRIKDIYDIYRLSNSHRIDGLLLLKMLGKYKDLDIIANYPFTEERMAGLYGAYNKLTLGENIIKPDFKEVIEHLEKFILPLLEEEISNFVWEPTNKEWRER